MIKNGPEVLVEGALTLKAPLELVAIRPKLLGAGKSMQVIAERPDGSSNPLIWIYNYNPEFAHSFFLKHVLDLPAGTRIVCSPPGAGTLALISQ